MTKQQEQRVISNLKLELGRTVIVINHMSAKFFLGDKHVALEQAKIR